MVGALEDILAGEILFSKTAQVYCCCLASISPGPHSETRVCFGQTLSLIATIHNTGQQASVGIQVKLLLQDNTG